MWYPFTGENALTSYKWRTLDELAEYLKLSRAKLYRMVQERNDSRVEDRQSVAVRPR
jgi:predicted transcriptional regulator